MYSLVKPVANKSAPNTRSEECALMPSNWPLEFHLKLMGAYRWVPMAIALKRKILNTIRGDARVGEQSPEIPSA